MKKQRSKVKARKQAKKAAIRSSSDKNTAVPDDRIPVSNGDVLISVHNLWVDFGSGENCTHAVRGVSFNIKKGETVALVGESGSGKTVTALSIMRLLPYPTASHPSGAIHYRGEDLLKVPENKLRHYRGNAISMIFQEPMTSLNPLHTIEQQVGEVLELHRGLSGERARERVLDLLNKVGIKDPEKRLTSYPHQLSGGQRQRVMIAMALANEPDLLIADEPTTALDVTIQAQILELLRDLQRELGMALLLITHDLGIVRKMAERTCVMKNGEIVEQGKTNARADECRTTRRTASRKLQRCDRDRNVKSQSLVSDQTRSDAQNSRLRQGGERYLAATTRKTNAWHRRGVRLRQDHFGPRPDAADFIGRTDLVRRPTD